MSSPTLKPADVLARFSRARLLVVGDVMLDRYIYGTVARISPEAPVPVVRKSHETTAPGGAANTAANIAALGANVALLGVVGADEGAAAVREALAAKCVDAGLLMEDATRPTSLKTRIVAHQQQVVRVDTESSAPLASALVDTLVERFHGALKNADAVVLSDYAKGVLTPELSQQLIALARAANVPVLADPKTLSPAPWRGVTILKPNRLELGVLAGRKIQSHAETVDAAGLVLAQLDGGALLVTEGADGMTLFEAGKPPARFHSATRSVFDVTGAGDTVLAVLATALAAGATLAVGAELAQRAATLVVQKLGTEVVRAEELAAALSA